jgi:adenylate kinase family enzyme
VGKGTACKQYVKKHPNVVHISPGELLRKQPDEARTKRMLEGKLAPTTEVIDLILEEMQRCPASMYLLDGFPRSIEQYQQFLLKATHTLVFECSEEQAVKYVQQRAKRSGRVDDTEACLRRRFRGFREETVPVIKYLPNVLALDSTRTFDEIVADMEKFLS